MRVRFYYAGSDVFKMVAIIFGIVGFVFACVSIGLWVSFIKIQGYEGKADGTVIWNEATTRYEDGVEKVSYFPVVQFVTSDGESVEVRSSFGTNPPRYRVGQSVAINYDINNPNDWVVGGDMTPLIMALSVTFATTCLVAGTLFAIHKHYG